MNHKDFHDQTFDDATLLKLDIFRGYIREWLPVFLKRPTYPEVHIYDFFAGPGTDAAGNPGSPLVIIEELEECLKVHSTPASSEVRIILHFNDNDCEKISKLEDTVKERSNTLSYKVTFTCKDFNLALLENQNSIRDQTTANLIIMDQCGFKHVDSNVFSTLIHCDTTDILFFISSSFIRRFAKEEEVRKYINIPNETVETIPAKDIHRFICKEFYQKLIPEWHKYYVAPFSIEKDSSTNIYGIIFGTSNLLGLDKFLNVCWKTDGIAGAANYNIDEEISFGGQTSLFEDHKVSRKQDKFQKDMMEFIKQEQPDNRKLYWFVLTNGFTPKHANEILKVLQSDERLDVINIDADKEARKGSFYLNWSEFKSDKPRVRFTLKETDYVF